jgi:hypothetical protein
MPRRRTIVKEQHIIRSARHQARRADSTRRRVWRSSEETWLWSCCINSWAGGVGGASSAPVLNVSANFCFLLLGVLEAEPKGFQEAFDCM